MEFKVPFPIFKKNWETEAQLSQSECEHLSLPFFEKKDFTELILNWAGLIWKGFQRQETWIQICYKTTC